MLRPLFEFAFARHFERSETASSPRFMRSNLSFRASFRQPPGIRRCRACLSRRHETGPRSALEPAAFRRDTPPKASHFLALQTPRPFLAPQTPRAFPAPRTLQAEESREPAPPGASKIIHAASRTWFSSSDCFPIILFRNPNKRTRDVPWLRDKSLQRLLLFPFHRRTFVSFKTPQTLR